MPSRRPATIAELAEKARIQVCEPGQELKYYLRIAEKYRRNGKNFAAAGDLEAGFVEYAKAATVVLEKLPKHKDYQTLLSPAQRQNLGLNGQDILDSLSDLKPVLVERYEKWLAKHPNGVQEGPANALSRSKSASQNPTRVASPPRASSSVGRIARQQQQYEDGYGQPYPQQQQQQQSLAQYSQPSSSSKQYYDDQSRRLAEERDLWRRQGEDNRRRSNEEKEWERERDRSRRAGPVVVSTASADAKRKEEAVAAAHRAAAGASSPAPYPSDRPVQRRNTYEYVSVSAPPTNSYEDLRQQQQEEMRKREEEITRRREERKREQEAISKRQQEADIQFHSTRQQIVAQQTSSNAAIAAATAALAQTSLQPPSSAPSPSPSYSVRAPRAVASSTASSLLDQYGSIEPLPLESPTRIEDDTDTEGKGSNRGSNGRMAARQKARLQENGGTPLRPSVRSPLYPPPMTTTSPPPNNAHIRYPELMSNHQKHQGYVPSLSSMFNLSGMRPNDPSSLLFGSNASGQSGGLYPSNALPQLSSTSALFPPPLPPPMPSASSSPAYPYGMPNSQAYPGPQQQPYYPQYPRPQPPVPGPPPPPPPPLSTQFSAPRMDTRSTSGTSTRTERQTRPHPAPPILKPISLPRDSLPRFLSIAALNTSQNKETCGLLLGKDKGHKFVVTTLLIPKQHSTSDTCTMDEEELVLQFTEERSLITLGWIHTHPSQSCFMSSVDLHTHSGFQRMLPESFAVVCAPKSTPNFGIFRLTDPPGLETILSCNAKEAFHPHPDVPIYTDADKGHVTMKDISLEIVDLR